MKNIKTNKRTDLNWIKSQSIAPQKDFNYHNFGASYERETLQSWFANSESPDTDLTNNFDTLRARSRDLYMGSPIASAGIRRVRTSVIGTGLTLNSQIDYKFLNLSEAETKEFEQNAEREWLNWTSTTACDASRQCNFHELSSLVLLSAMLSGDVFVALPYIKRSDSPYDLKIYVIESDRVCNPQTSESYGKNLLEGVEFGKFGEPLAYYIAKYHPRSQLLHSGIQEWTRVPAFGSKSGRKNILHIMPDRERPNQRRGVPFLAPVIEILKQLERYTDAEVMAAVVSGMFTGFITSEKDELDLTPFDKEKVHEHNMVMGSGTISHLKPGENIEFGNPGRPNTSFGVFVDQILTLVGASLEISKEVLLSSFSASYSASQASLLLTNKMFKMRREWFINNFCQPIYEAFITYCVATGRLKAPKFFDDDNYRKAYCGAIWSGDSFGAIDELKAIKAAQARIELGISTRTHEANEITGLKYDDTVEQLKRESLDLPQIIENLNTNPDNKW